MYTNLAFNVSHQQRFHWLIKINRETNLTDEHQYQFAYFRDQYANALQRQRPQNGLLDFLKLYLAHLQVSGVGFHVVGCFTHSRS